MREFSSTIPGHEDRKKSIASALGWSAGRGHGVACHTGIDFFLMTRNVRVFLQTQTDTVDLVATVSRFDMSNNNKAAVPYP